MNPSSDAPDAASSRDGPIWLLEIRDSSYLRIWDDDIAGVMYDASSGDTHLLEPLDIELLRAVSLKPCRALDLSSEFCDLLPDNPDMPPLSMIETSLVRLRDLGLVASRTN